MSNKQQPLGTNPEIGSISPEMIPANTEADLQIKGKNFTKSCIVLVDSYSALAKFIDAQTIEAKLTPQESGSTGRKRVLVHDGDTGGISNEKLLDVVAESRVLDKISIQMLIDIEEKYLAGLSLEATGSSRDRAVLPYDSAKVFGYAQSFCAGGNDCPDGMFVLDCTHFLSHCMLATGVVLTNPTAKCKKDLCIRVNDLAAAFANSIGKYSNVKQISKHSDTKKGDFCFIPAWFGLTKEHGMLLADKATSAGARVFAHTNNHCGEFVSFEGESCVYYRIDDAS